jgi:cyclic pyranopterin phosphate synthase
MLLDKFNRPLDVIEIQAGDTPAATQGSSNGIEGQPAPLFPSEHIVTFVKVMAALGLRKVLLAGREPLARPDIVELVAGLASARPKMEITLRTGSRLLPQFAHKLAAAGADGLSVTIPAVDRDSFTAITGQPGQALDDLMEGMRVAAQLGVRVVVEVLPTPGGGRMAVAGALLWAISMGYAVKAVEGPGAEGSGDFMGWAIGEIGKAHKLLEGDSRYAWKTADGGVPVEFVTEARLQNCYECHRLWLSADGKVKLCSHHYEEHDLNELFADGSWETELLDFAAKIPLNKPQGFFLRDWLANGRRP